MRTRKRWWFAGLALALLAACVGEWNWSERPPYEFLKGARVHFVQVLGKGTRVDYSFTTPYKDMLARARLELGQEDAQFNLPGDLSAQWQGVVIATRNSTIDGPGFPPPPEGTTGWVILSRSPKGADRLKAWFYGIRWKGWAKGPHRQGRP